MNESCWDVFNPSALFNIFASALDAVTSSGGGDCVGILRNAVRRRVSNFAGSAPALRKHEVKRLVEFSGWDDPGGAGDC